MIDTAVEKVVDFNQALPDGRRLAYSTWWRWFKHGIKGVRLETIVIGGRRFTSREALQRFFDATTVASSGSPPIPTQTTRKRADAVKKAKLDLAAELA